MNKQDSSFLSGTGLEYAIDLLRNASLKTDDLPGSFPDCGIGEIGTLEALAPHVLG